MKVLKNFEAIFLGTLVMSWAAFATADVPTVQAAPQVQAAATSAASVQVVVIKAKRMSAAEKAAQV